jgi:branched-chain amino acid aminotransferase
MAETDPPMFMEGLQALIRLDRDWIPSSPGTSLYIRPTMIATEAALGVKPSSRYLFFIILGPVGRYYPEGFSPTRIYVTKSYVRAAKGGVGETKTGGNYAASLYAATKAQELGYTQVLWLDAAEHKYVEEVGTSNIFFQIDQELITPPLAGTIRPGVTRDSVLFLAREWGLPVNERPITIDEVIKAAENGRLKEMFATGTAAVISPVGEIGYQERVIPVADGKTGPLAQRLYDEITGIQYGLKEDPYGWIVKID